MRFKTYSFLGFILLLSHGQASAEILQTIKVNVAGTKQALEQAVIGSHPQKKANIPSGKIEKKPILNPIINIPKETQKKDTISAQKTFNDIDLIKSITKKIEQCFKSPGQCNDLDRTIDEKVCSQFNNDTKINKACQSFYTIKLMQDNAKLLTQAQTCLLAGITAQPLSKKNQQKKHGQQSKKPDISVQYKNGSDNIDLQCYYQKAYSSNDRKTRSAMGFNAILTSANKIHLKYCLLSDTITPHSTQSYCTYLENNISILNDIVDQKTPIDDTLHDQFMDSFYHLLDDFQQYFNQDLASQIHDTLQSNIQSNLSQLDMQLSTLGFMADTTITTMSSFCQDSNITLTPINNKTIKPSEVIMYLFEPKYNNFNAFGSLNASTTDPLTQQYNQLATTYLSSTAFNQQVAQQIIQSRLNQYTVTLTCDANRKTYPMGNVTHHDWLLLSSYLRMKPWHQKRIAKLVVDESALLYEYNILLADMRYMAFLIRKQEEQLGIYQAFNSLTQANKDNDRLEAIIEALNQNTLSYRTGQKWQEPARKTSPPKPSSDKTIPKLKGNPKSKNAKKSKDTANRIKNNPSSGTQNLNDLGS